MSPHTISGAVHRSLQLVEGVHVIWVGTQAVKDAAPKVEAPKEAAKKAVNTGSFHLPLRSSHFEPSMALAEPMAYPVRPSASPVGCTSKASSPLISAPALHELEVVEHAATARVRLCAYPSIRCVIGKWCSEPGAA